MIVDHVGLHAGEAVGMVELDADVVVDRDDDRVVGHEEFFGLLEKRVALGQIGLTSGGGDECIEAMSMS